MALDFKKDKKFEDFGSLEEYFNNYGDCTVSIEDIEEPNICKSSAKSVLI